MSFNNIQIKYQLYNPFIRTLVEWEDETLSDFDVEMFSIFKGRIEMNT